MKVANHIPWREQLDLHDTEALCDEFGWDELFEALDDGGGSPVSAVRRLPTPTPNFRRAGDIKTASATNWDSEFASAQAHARDVLSKLGGATR